MADPNIPDWARDPPAAAAEGVPDWARQPNTYALKDVPAAALSNVGSDLSKSWDEITALATKLGTDPVAVAKALGENLWGGAVSAVAPDVRAAMRVTGADPQGFNQWAQRQGAGESPLSPILAISDPVRREALYEGVKHDVAERPVSSAANLALALTGGGATVGRGALAGATKTAAAARLPIELSSGVSSEAQRLAMRAGELGGAESKALRSNMVNPDWAGMQDTGQRAVRGAAAERGAQYATDMASTRASTAPGSYTPLANVITQTRSEFTGAGGFPTNQAALDVLSRMENKIYDHVVAVAARPTATSLDDLKKALGEIRQGTEQGTPARRAADAVYNATRAEIVRVAPEYGKAMERYASASEDMTNAIKSLGLGERSTRFSTGGKLLSAMRADASVARGAREADLARLAQHEPTLPYQIAGATMNPRMPRGLVGRGKAAMELGLVGGAAGTAAFLPHLLTAAPALLAASPRFVGRTAHALGTAQRGARAVGATQRNIGLAADLARMAAEEDDQGGGLLSPAGQRRRGGLLQ